MIMTELPYREVHLDFHTPDLPYQLGKNFDKETFQRELQTGHVNSITLTARDHYGHIYYDSKFPARHPQMKGDFLMGLVDACHEIGVNCPLYLTAGWDAYMADRHPEWLERHPDGTMFGFENFGQLEPGWKTLCFNTAYTDYLFEQTKETMQHFAGKLDGLFFDIVRQDACCCNECIEKMVAQGYDPAIEQDRIDFGQKTKIEFKKSMTAFVHEIDPNCSVFYNEGNITPAIRPNLDDYGHFEIESLASGDWGYQHFPVVVRYAKNLGKEYMGMTGRFERNWADFGSIKNQAALEYECFLAAAHGAKCSIGDQMYGDGTLQPAVYDLIGKVYSRVEQLEPWIRNVQAVTELAIMHPNLYHKAKGKVDISLAGAVNMLNEAHFQFDIIDDQMNFDQYKVIILPDELEIKKDLAEKLEVYVQNGGKILSTYKAGCIIGTDRSIPSMGLTYVSEAAFEPMYAVYPKSYDAFLGKAEQVLHGKGMYIQGQGERVGELWEPMYNRSYQHYYSHYQAPIAEKSQYPLMIVTNGGIHFSHQLFTMYKTMGIREYKVMIVKALEQLLHGTFVDTDAPTTSDVILNYQPQGNRLLLNYLNYVPIKQSLRVETIEASTPVAQTNFSIDLEGVFKRLGIQQQEVQEITVAGKNQTLPFEIEDQHLHFTLPKLDGYEVIALQLA